MVAFTSFLEKIRPSAIIDWEFSYFILISAFCFSVVRMELRSSQKPWSVSHLQLLQAELRQPLRRRAQFPQSCDTRASAWMTVKVRLTSSLLTKFQQGERERQAKEAQEQAVEATNVTNWMFMSISVACHMSALGRCQLHAANGEQFASACLDV